jgi:glutamyl-tRNA reductase
MNHELVLLHRAGSVRFEFGKPAAESACDSIVTDSFFSFETCMRHILLLSSDSLGEFADPIREGDQVFKGEEAYRFLLEVICGLHSPLIGETEVYGQLKNKVSGFTFSTSPWHSDLRRMFRSLFEDAKVIREKHLKDLGSQSYGSVLRREAKGAKRVHILGAGHLVQEILPWLAKDGTEVHVYCRNPKKAIAILPNKVNVHGLSELVSSQSQEIFVVAAPVTAAWIKAWLPSGSRFRLIADLRSDSQVDRLAQNFGRTLELGEMLTRISANQIALEQRKTDALDDAKVLAEKRSRHSEYRPFGWEDVCA